MRKFTFGSVIVYLSDLVVMDVIIVYGRRKGGPSRRVRLTIRVAFYFLIGVLSGTKPLVVIRADDYRLHRVTFKYPITFCFARYFGILRFYCKYISVDFDRNSRMMYFWKKYLSRIFLRICIHVEEVKTAPSYH